MIRIKVISLLDHNSIKTNGPNVLQCHVDISSPHLPWRPVNLHVSVQRQFHLPPVLFTCLMKNWGVPEIFAHYAIILSHIKCRLHYGKCGGGEYLSCGKNYFKWIQHTTRIHATSFLVSAWFIVTDSADTFSDVILLNCFHFNVSTKYIIILSWSSIHWRLGAEPAPCGPDTPELLFSWKWKTTKHITIWKCMTIQFTTWFWQHTLLILHCIVLKYCNYSVCSVYWL